LAEEQLPDLSTDTKRVEHFNKKVEEFRKESSDVAEAPNQAFDMARQYAQQRVFPPFGFIAFPEDSKKHTPDEMGIGVAAGNVLFGAARFLDGLKKDSPGDLIEKGIDTYKGFDDSAAVNELTGATKMSFATVKEGFQEIQTAIRADDKDAEDPFEKSPILSKLNPDDIENLLDSTVLKFIKELGLKRADEASDKPTLDRGEASFTKVKELAAKTDTAAPKNIEASKLNTKDDPEYMARLEKAKREDALMDSVTTRKTGSKISSSDEKKLETKPAETITTETKPEGIRATETPVTTKPALDEEKAKNELVALSSNVTNTVTNNSNAISVLQDPDAKPAPVLKSETNTVTPETKGSTPAAAPAITQESKPTSTNPPIEPPKGETQAMQLGDKSSVSDDETPLLKMLGESMGMSADDIAKMFAGKEDNLQKGLDLTFGSEAETTGIKSDQPENPAQFLPDEPKSTIVEKALNATPGQAQKVAQQATAISTATKTSEPVKLAEAAPTPKQEPTPELTPEPAPPTAVQSEQTNMESTGAESKESPSPETKTPDDGTNKETGPNNDDLLRIMKEILKTLQGPLIVTESSPKYS
jgi:hypothetical protein